jgi:hypothetical protein
VNGFRQIPDDEWLDAVDRMLTAAEVPDDEWLDAVDRMLDAADRRDNIVPIRPTTQELLTQLACDAADTVSDAVWPNPSSRSLNGYGCDYCNREAVGGCFGFHACSEHMDRAARDGRSAHGSEVA